MASQSRSNLSLEQVTASDVSKFIQERSEELKFADSDEEFDDTRIETPRAVRNDISSHNSSSTRANIHPNSAKLYYRVRSTSTIPLKKSDDNEDEAYPYARTFRNTNGTPRRLPTEHIDHVKEKENVESHLQLPPAEGIQAPRVSYSSPLRKSIHRKSLVSSPPPNLKIRPLSMSGNERTHTSLIDPNYVEIDPPTNNRSQKTINLSKSKTLNSEILPEGNQIQRTTNPNGIPSERRKEEMKHVYTPLREDISRANLLERVNQTLDSMSNQELKFSSPMIHQRETKVEATSKVAQESSSSDSDEFIRKLSFKYRNTSPILGISTPKVVYPPLTNSILTKSPDRRKSEGSPRIKKTPGKVISSTSKSLNEFTDTQVQNFGEEWSQEKWKKLNRVVQSKAISRNEAINSATLMKEVGCLTREDLAQRINFLISLNKLMRRKTRHSSKNGIRKPI